MESRRYPPRGSYLELLGEARKAFDQAFRELFNPPCSFVPALASGWTVELDSVKGIVGLPFDQALKSDNPRLYLLWYYRHVLSHAHYCPYDAGTANLLYRAAVEAVSDPQLAHLALTLFSDLQVDCFYLPTRFGGIPYHVVVEFSKSRLVEPLDIYYSAYQVFYPEIRGRRIPEEIEVYGSMIAGVLAQPRTWVSKIRSVAAILYRLREYRRAYGRRLKKRLRRMPIALREDLADKSVEKIAEEMLGKVKRRGEAKTLYEQWIEPRLKNGGKQGFKPGEKKGKGVEGRISHGTEPKLPTEAGKPLKKIGREKLEEALWLRYWYKARASNSIIEYATLRGEKKPRVREPTYTVEWTAEDEMEDLDLEATIEEGKFRIGVNTVKWVSTDLQGGFILAEAYAPSTIIILDTSSSMKEAYDTASIAGFIAYLNAVRSGGKTAIINFSSKHVSADWDEDEDRKETLLSLHLEGMTILPTPVVKALTEEAGARCFILLITDGGFQNLEEACRDLESLARNEHQIVLIQIQRGGYYPDRVEKLSKITGITVHRVYNPERDLLGVVLKHTYRI